MVRISTVWDKIEDNQVKVFMVRGDESYARTTDIMFSLKPNTSDAVNGFVATAILDVLRDTDSSSITIYDGEDALSVVDWDYSNSNLEVTLPRLSWDIEHKLWAKYNGNTKCLKSKSEVISVIKSNPNLTDTSITNRTTTINYTSSDSITISARLNKASGSASLQGREITFYVDGVNKGTANTSNTSGDVSKNIGTLSNGLHEVAVVFDGDNPLGASELKFDISVGYNLVITEYPPTFINGVDNTVKVRISNQLNDPIANKSISFAGKTATSNENGIATFTNITSITNNATYYATHSGYTSTNVVMKSATLTGIDMTTDDGITVNGMSEPITIKLEGSGTLSDIPVTVIITRGDGSYTTHTYTTTKNGSVVVNYMGNASGEVVIYAEAPSLYSGETVTIDDLVYYAKARDNRGTLIGEGTRITITEDTSYIITPLVDNRNGYFKIPMPVHYWKAEFILTNFSGKYRSGIEIQGQKLNQTNNLGDKYRIINDADGCRVWRNDELIHSDMVDWDALWFMVNEGTNTVKCRMFFDELKVWSLD